MNQDQIFNRSMLQACQADDINEFCRLLQERPSALHMQTPFGSWLHVAASSGSMRVLDYLLSSGLNPNTRGGTFKGSALNEAASKGRVAAIQKLLDAGAQFDLAEPERNPLFGAIYGGHIEVVKLLVNRGINYRVSYTGESMKGMDAIAFAQERGQLEISGYLLSLQNAA